MCMSYSIVARITDEKTSLMTERRLSDEVSFKVRLRLHKTICRADTDAISRDSCYIRMHAKNKKKMLIQNCDYQPTCAVRLCL